MGGDPLISSSCIHIWNVPHVLFHRHFMIPIGEKAYTNVCTNTDVWLDGDIISAFASLVCTKIIPFPPRALMKSGHDVP